jgi:hypothetical protein
MYEITAISVKNKTEFKLDLDTATLEELADVSEPANLPSKDKLRYFKRQQELERNARVGLVYVHDARLARIMEGLLKRAIGPERDEVHKKIRDKCSELAVILETWKAKAQQGSKDFKEINLVKALQGPLQQLSEHLEEDTEGPQKHVADLRRARIQVGDALARGEAGIRAWVQGASIRYRGSLATGWRNAKKSTAGTAQRINLLQFDSDAFVDIPTATWGLWHGMRIVTDMQKEGKMDLSELMVRTRAAENVLTGQEKEAFTRVLNQLLGIETVQDQLKLAMKTVSGYKMNQGDEADFSFVLQSSKKTGRELESGNLYPLEEVANAGLPLTEARLTLLYEDGTLMVRMPERHVSMTKPVERKTYTWESNSIPHTQDRPTEAMQIEAYLRAPAPLRHVDAPQPRGLVEHWMLLEKIASMGK